MGRQTIAELNELLKNEKERADAFKDRYAESQEALTIANNQRDNERDRRERTHGEVMKREELLRSIRGQIDTFLRSHFDVGVTPETVYVGNRQMHVEEASDAIRFLRCIYELTRRNEVPF